MVEFFFFFFFFGSHTNTSHPYVCLGGGLGVSRRNASHPDRMGLDLA